MPELPEVETIRRVLEPQIKGLTITAVTVNRPEVIGHPTAEEFCQTLTGQTIDTMTRRGKFLSVLLNSGDYFVFRMGTDRWSDENYQDYYSRTRI